MEYLLALYSRPNPQRKDTKMQSESTPVQESKKNHPTSKTVGLDLGRRNVATMIDSDGITLRYTSKQCLFESKMLRFRKILRREKDKAGVTQLEAKLSEHSHRNNDPEEF